ncbi:MAG: hypothetical protein ACLUNZ_10050 [Evtepia sp.]
MYEHYENYDRYIPDVMLKKHKKHEEYLSNAYAGMSHEEIYKSKLGTVEDAIGLIESGDCIVLVHPRLRAPSVPAQPPPHR